MADPQRTARELEVARRADALDAAQVGVWDWNVATGELAWDETIARLHGVDPETFDGTMEAFFERVHPDDLGPTQSLIQAAVARGGEFLTEFRVVKPDGQVRWIQGRGGAILGADGRCLRMIGLGMDTTELRNVRERAGRSLDFASDGLAILDPDWRVVYANPAAAQLVRREVHELVGNVLWDVFPEAVGTTLWQELTEATTRAAPRQFESFHGDLGWFDVHVFVAPDGITVFLRNIDERRRVETERQGLVDTLQSAIERAHWLQTITARLAECHTVTEVAQVILVLTRRALDTLYSGVALVDAAGEFLEFQERHELPDPTRDTWGRVPLSVDAPITRAAVTGAVLFHESTEELLASFPNLADTSEIVGQGAFANLPLMARGSPMGVLSVSWPASREITAAERAFLITVAAQCSQAIERARLIERERETARMLQRAILPELSPRLGPVRCAARYLPAELGVEVGGDWYDAFTLPNGDIALVIGDVAGHGLPAASTMAQLRNMLRAYAFSGVSPADVLSQLDAVARESAEGHVASCFVGFYEAAASTLTFANAGHLPPIVLEPSGPPTVLSGAHGVLLGAGGELPLETRVVPPGTRAVLFTDGLIERRGVSITQSIDDLVSVLQDAPEELEALCEFVIDRARRGPREDDVCLLAVEFGG